MYVFGNGAAERQSGRDAVRSVILMDVLWSALERGWESCPDCFTDAPSGTEVDLTSSELTHVWKPEQIHCSDFRGEFWRLSVLVFLRVPDDFCVLVPLK